jgi:single-stranded-DNA-specific exonuclease
MLTPVLNIDAPVSTQTLNLALVDSLATFEPFGAGNPKPVFVTGGLTIRHEPFVMKDKHLKLKLWDGERRLFEAVWWDGVERSKGRTPLAGQSIEIAYTPEANVWQGNRSLQLIVEDIRLDPADGRA